MLDLQAHSREDGPRVVGSGSKGDLPDDFFEQTRLQDNRRIAAFCGRDEWELIGGQTAQTGAGLAGTHLNSVRIDWLDQFHALSSKGIDQLRQQFCRQGDSAFFFDLCRNPGGNTGFQIRRYQFESPLVSREQNIGKNRQGCAAGDRVIDQRVRGSILAANSENAYESPP